MFLVFNKIRVYLLISLLALLTHCSGSSDGTSGSLTPFNQSFVLVSGQNSTTVVSSTVTASVQFNSPSTEKVTRPLYAVFGLVPQMSVILAHIDSSNPNYNPQTINDTWASKVASDSYVLFISDVPVYCSSDLAPGDNREDGLAFALFFDKSQVDGWTSGTIVANQYRVLSKYGANFDYQQTIGSLGSTGSINSLDSTTVGGTLNYSKSSSSTGADVSVSGNFTVSRCN